VLGLATTSARRRGLRSDARENRDRILAAAQAFAEHGLSVSLIEIARRAGVGNATLHRNFTKEQLVEELFCDWDPSGARSPRGPWPIPILGTVSSVSSKTSSAPATAPSARCSRSVRIGGSGSACSSMTC
jgi:hypothetical protein